MNRLVQLATAMTAAFSLGFFCHSFITSDKQASLSVLVTTPTEMKLGAFSVSLSVKNLEASKSFYEKLGFAQVGGSMESNYLIMKNEGTLIGLFQGMFEGNILTFNPGWDENAQALEEFEDVREIQKKLKAGTIEILNPADENTTGPASCMVKDPDGNMILFDQHL
ncbi:VOC family protein [Algoriphagus sp.]|uniref:VOC family protein n=1 Tax=Algoriphagus sp. TaxID=1872435 RepID=UPI00328E66A5